MNESSIGFLGVGTLARAISLSMRGSWPKLDIQLSPRSASISRELALADTKMHWRASNAEVVDASGVIFLTMRPPQFVDAVRDISFRPDQLVISCLTGISIEEVRRFCAPADVIRVLPTPSIERCEGPIVLCPPLLRARSLFGGLGDIIEAQDEAELTAIWPCSTFMSSYFTLQAVLIDWVVMRGVNRSIAVIYVRSLLKALAETGASVDLDSLPELILAHETPGGLNYRVRLELENAGWFELVGKALDATTRLRGAELTSETTL